LPTHDAIFDAIDPAEASDILLNRTSQAAPLTLRSVVQRLMDDKPIDLEVEQLQIDSFFGLFLMLSGRMAVPIHLSY
jgi:hypothetical protein